MNWNQVLEDAFVGKLITTLVDEGYRLEVSDQDGGGLFVYAVEDGGEKPADGYTCWVRLVPGNGANIITDHTVNLKDVLEPVHAFAEVFQQ